MNLRTFALPFALVAALPAAAALAPGVKAPGIQTMIAKGGKTANWSLGRALKKGPVVLYFYPAAFTPGCTREANAFAEAIPQFRQHGATVIGLSADPIETLKRFSVSECRSKFAVGVASTTTIAAYDVVIPDRAMSNRTSYVISRAGRIVYAFSSGDYRDHVPNTLKALEALHAAHANHH